MPNFPVSEIEKIEAIEKNEAFSALAQHVKRVELLGTDDSARQSFHRLFTTEGSTSVLFQAARYEGIGRTIHIIANDEVMTIDNGRIVYIQEFFVSQDGRSITLDETWLSRGPKDIRWELLPDTGPLLCRFHDRTVIQRGRESGLSLPEYHDKPLTSLKNIDQRIQKDIDQRIYAEELCVLLEKLSELSLEPPLPTEEK